MAAARMHDAAGSWFTEVGTPAESGVAGALPAARPGQVGIGTFPPRLDGHGNSVRGIRLFRRLSTDMCLDLMETDPWGAWALRAFHTEAGRTVVKLQGTIDFTAAEEILHELDTAEPTSGRVDCDVSRVSRFVDIGRRMVLGGMRRLALDGFEVGLSDPDGVLPDPDMGDGTRPLPR